MCYNVPTNDEIYSVNLITNQFERLRSCPIDMDIACFPLCFSFLLKLQSRAKGSFMLSCPLVRGLEELFALRPHWGGQNQTRAAKAAGRDGPRT